MTTFNTTNPNVIYTVEMDTDVADPTLESGAGVRIWAYRGGYRSTISKKPHSIEMEIFEGFLDKYEPEKAVQVANRHLKIFTSLRGELSLYSHGGYTQSDWLDTVIWVEDGYGTAESWGEVWSLWANGEVYGVTRQEIESCDECDCENVVSEGETLWGVFAGSEQEAAAILAAEYNQEIVTGERV